MSNCTEQELGRWLHDYELGLLNEDEAERFEIHLMNCDLCFAEVQSFRPVAETLSKDRDIRAQINTLATVEPSTSISFRERLIKALWPESASLLLKPALTYGIVLLLLPLAYMGLSDRILRDSDTGLEYAGRNNETVGGATPGPSSSPSQIVTGADPGSISENEGTGALPSEDLPGHTVTSDNGQSGTAIEMKQITASSIIPLVVARGTESDSHEPLFSKNQYVVLLFKASDEMNSWNEMRIVDLESGETVPFDLNSDAQGIIVPAGSISPGHYALVISYHHIASSAVRADTLGFRVLVN